MECMGGEACSPTLGSEEAGLALAVVPAVGQWFFQALCQNIRGYSFGGPHLTSSIRT